MTLALSVLDLSPVGSGSTAAAALHNTLALAKRAEQLGYTRYWLAEHHNMPGIASAATAVIIGQVARETSKIRVGSGGVMLPNHAPLAVAEQFLTLEAFFPGRIDLGIGRAPGTDPRTALALRRSAEMSGADNFPEQLADLMAFAGGGFSDDNVFRAVRAVPTGVPLPPVWLLGSSDYSAILAAQRGLGFVYAHHINPHGAVEAMRIYRDRFRPSEHLDAPRALLTVSAICAATHEEANTLARSMDLAWLRLHSGRPGVFPSVAEAEAYPYSLAEEAQIRLDRARVMLGTPSAVKVQIGEIAEVCKVDEVIVTTIVYSHDARIRSYELLAAEFALTQRV